MDGLKSKAAKSLFWNGLDKVGFQLIGLIVGIVTARLLSRDDFGHIAALALFTYLSNVFIESGFTSAMVRREGNTDTDYTAVLSFNVLLSVAFYALLFVCAPLIAAYFHTPLLTTLARVLFLNIIINAFSIVQTIILTKHFRFRELAIADITGAVIAGVITVIMAVKGFGYWAIAAQQLSQTLFRTLMLWCLSRWRPVRHANFRVIGELFSFSASLIVTSTISTCARYIYNFFIRPPRYSMEQLGCYGQAYKFHQIPHTVITTTVTGVAYPLISSLNGDRPRQLLYLRKLMKICAFITFPVMSGLYAIAPNMITVVLTDKWQPMLPYFNILIISATFLPFANIALNTIVAVGKPRVNMYLEMVRNGLMLLMLALLNSTIEIMLYGYLIATFAAYIIYIIALTRYTGYTLIGHLRDILPYAAIAAVMGIAVMLLPRIVTLNVYLLFALQILIGALLYLGAAMLLGSRIIKDIRELIFKR